MYINALKIFEDGTRNKVPINEFVLRNDDPQAEFFIVPITNLRHKPPPFGQTYMVEPGDYYIFIEKDGMELLGANVTIK
jgi:LysM repeat protein